MKVHFSIYQMLFLALDVAREERCCFPEVGTMGSAPKYELSSSFPIIVPNIWILSLSHFTYYPLNPLLWYLTAHPSIRWGKKQKLEWRPPNVKS